MSTETFLPQALTIALFTAMLGAAPIMLNSGAQAADDAPGATSPPDPLVGRTFDNLEALFDSDLSIGDIIELSDGRLFLAYSSEGETLGSHSSDGGRTWGPAFRRTDAAGNPVGGISLGSLLLLGSGELGFQTLSDYRFLFRISSDEGRTWSEPISMLPGNDLGYGAANDRGIVMSTGRVIYPVAWRMDGPRSPEPDMPLGSDIEETLTYSFSVYSDDHGRTWKRSRNLAFLVLDGKYEGYKWVPQRGKGGFHHFEEPAVAERSDGSLLMFGRTYVGRIFQSLSPVEPLPWPQSAFYGTQVEPDPAGGAGVIWNQPTPTPLASTYAPSALVRVPALNALLCVWNQASVEETLQGISRHRLSTALSFDDGETWWHYKNLESLDDETRIWPPAVEDLHGVYGYHYHQPWDRQRYHRAPGSVRSCYPNVRVLSDTVIISYNYGGSNREDPTPRVTLRTRVLPVEWFTTPQER